jgi:rhamnosyl/mannosyltransferase
MSTAITAESLVERPTPEVTDFAKGLRVCHLGKYYPPASGGMENHVQQLARGQAELGASVRVVCVNHLDAAGNDVTWRRFARTATVEEHDGPVRVTRIGRRAVLARMELCPGLRRLLRRLAAETDVLHLHTPNPSMVLALNAWAPPVPLVVSHHSDVIRQKLLGLAFRTFEARVYRRALALCPTSPEYAAGSPLLRRFDDRVRPLPLGIDLTPFLEPSPAARAVADDWRARYGSPLWLSVGRLVYYKGLDNAVRALVNVPGRLLIIGRGPLESSLRALAGELGVADRIVWCGSVDNDTLAGAYRAATALWFPSNARSEGFGLVQVEAMASGCPVINTRVPHSGVAWVCRDGREGLTVSMNDPAALAVAANRLLHEPELRERLATAARERARAEFGARLMAERSLRLYADCLEARR